MFIIPFVVVDIPPTHNEPEAEIAVVEAFPNEVWPDTIKEPNVPTEVSDEFTIPEPKVFDVKISVPAIWYFVWVFITPFVVVDIPPTHNEPEAEILFVFKPPLNVARPETPSVPGVLRFAGLNDAVEKFVA